MKKYIKVLVMILPLFIILSCNNEADIEPTPKEQNLSMNGNVSTRSLSDVSSFNGMLHFNDEFELRAFIESNNQFRVSWSNDPVIRASNIEDFNNDYNYVSLESYYMSLNGNEKSEEGYMAYPVMQYLLNEKREFAVGSKIYKYLIFGEVAIIENLSIEGLNDVRESGLHSSHDEVSYFNTNTGVLSFRQNPTGVGPNSNPSVCSGYLSLLHEIGIGATSNRVSLDGLVKGTGLCPYGLKLTIDWGDGTVMEQTGVTSFSRHHDYLIDGFSTGECQDFIITVDIEWVSDCPPCEKGRKYTKVIEVELCRIPDVCLKSDVVKFHQEVKTFIGGKKYKLIGEIGIDNSLNIFNDWTKTLWAKASFFEAEHPLSVDYTPAYASAGIGLDIVGPIFGESSCSTPILTIDTSPSEVTGYSYEENHNLLNTAYTKRTGEERLTGIFWAGTGSNEGNFIKFEIEL